MTGADLIRIIEENNLKNEEFRICNGSLYEPRAEQIMLVDHEKMKQIVEKMIEEMMDPYKHFFRSFDNAWVSDD